MQFQHQMHRQQLRVPRAPELLLCHLNQIQVGCTDHKPCSCQGTECDSFQQKTC